MEENMRRHKSSVPLDFCLSLYCKKNVNANSTRIKCNWFHCNFCSEHELLVKQIPELMQYTDAKMILENWLEQGVSLDNWKTQLIQHLRIMKTLTEGKVQQLLQCLEHRGKRISTHDLAHWIQK
jgi:hypothetical protein